MTSLPYIKISNVFNPNDYGVETDSLTLGEADLRYIRQGGPANVSSLMINSQTIDFSAISGITPGIAQNSKALILGPTGNISGIGTLSASIVQGLTRIETESTSTSLITSSTICDSYGLHLHSALSASNGIYGGSAIAFNNAVGDNVPLSAIWLDKIASGHGQLVIACRNGSTCIERARFSSTGLSVAGSLTLSTTGTGAFIPNLKFWNSTTSTYDNFDQSLYLSITQGSAAASKAVVLNSSKNITGLGYVSADTLNGTSLVSGTSADFGSLSINSISVISSARTIQNIGTITTSDTIKCSRNSSGQTFNSSNGSSGFALYHFVNGDGYFGSTSSNDLVLQTNGVGRMRINGSTGAISGITNLSATNIAGFLTTGNQTAISTVGTLTELGVGTTYPSTEYMLISGSGSAYLDGSYTRMCRFVGSNATPVQFQIEVNNGSNGTSTNASWVGNITSNDLRFGTGSSTQMTLKSSGLLGVGTTTPLAGIHCVNQATYTWGAGGFTVYRLRTDSGVTESTLGPITYSVMGGIFAGYVGCEAIVMSSDRRLKQDIKNVSIGYLKPLYDQGQVKSYHWKKKPNSVPEVGLIAQDILNLGYVDLVEMHPDDDPNLKSSSDPSLEPLGVKLTINYPRLASYNMAMIQHLLTEVADLKNRLANIDGGV